MEHARRRHGASSSDLMRRQAVYLQLLRLEKLWREVQSLEEWLVPQAWYVAAAGLDTVLSEPLAPFCADRKYTQTTCC